MDFFHFLSEHSQSLWQHLFEHIYLSFSAILLAVVIGTPLGIFSYQRRTLRRIILPINNIFQTIPSLALLAFLIPFLGIGFKPTIVTLMVYALLPITRNTYVGLEQISDDMIEAAYGLGFTRWQRLRLVELPLALPVIISGIRVATAMAIGITTIAAFIGAGGLGTFITQGLALDSSGLILLGAIPTALLALIVDFLFAQTESLLVKPAVRKKFEKLRCLVVFIIFALFAWLFVHQFFLMQPNKKNQITIATKNFSESYILGYLMKDIIEAKTKIDVDLKMNLGGTTIIQNALLRGAVDLYPEYSGTGYVVVLHQKKILSSKATWNYVKYQYKKQFHLIWLPPFGFDNSQTLAVRADFAKKYHLKTLSDLKRIDSKLTVAAPAEFIKRPDALPALQRAYGLHFKKIIAMEPDLVYRAIKNKAVNVIEVFTTDARIQSHHLVPLIDDKHIYPPYAAAPVIREATLNKYPKIKSALALLANRIDTKTMRQLNAEVELQHKNPAAVAKSYLRKLGFNV